ncbi:MAG: IPExxxVDY family protein [Flavobacteriales bacterium]|nr:IPExxxVDY family protein [Flavobacteriales bacterium]
MARHKLDMEPDPEVTLIGISCHVHDYRLCWALNRELGISLARRDKDITDQGPETIASYAAFDHVDEENQAQYLLVHNHSGDGVLLKEHKQADFFLLVDEAAPLTPEELIDHVRKTEFVLMAFPLDARKERGAHKLLQ